MGFLEPHSGSDRLVQVSRDGRRAPGTGVIRAAASEPDVAGMMREFLAREVFGPVAKLLDADDGEFRVSLVGSQIVGLIMARYVARIEPLA